MVVLAIMAMTATAPATGWLPVLAAAAQARTVTGSASGPGCRAATAEAQSCVAAAPVPQDALVRVVVSSGAHECPNSGPGASCLSGTGNPLDMGVASLPDGQVPCSSDPAKPTSSAPGACSATTDAGPATPPAAAPNAAVNPTPDASATPAAPSTPSVASVKAIQPLDSNPQIKLSADKTTLAAGDKALLTVTAEINVSGTPWVIEIIDQSTHTLVGGCSQGNICQMAFGATAGTHTFIAYVALPSPTIPANGTRLTSNALDVRWLNITLEASDPSIVGRGKPVTFTATASAEVRKIGYRIELVDTTTGQRLTYCSQGIMCSASVIEPNAGTHLLVAALSLVAASSGSQVIQVKSAPVSASWINVTLSASTTYPSQGGTAWLSASANVDLTNTPWSIFIYMSPRLLIDSPCHSGKRQRDPTRRQHPFVLRRHRSRT